VTGSKDVQTNMNACKVISVANQTGGVGKTSTVINLGIALRQLGKRVLLVDLDTQTNLTSGLGYFFPDELHTTISTAFTLEMDYRLLKPESLILRSNDIDFIPSNIELFRTEEFINATIDREHILSNILSHYKPSYDYILLDCPPNISVIVINALGASNEAIIPTECELFSSKGLDLIIGTVNNVKRRINKELRIKGILLTMVDARLKSTEKVIKTIYSVYNGSVNIFQTRIPLSSKVSTYQSRGKSIMIEKNNKVTIAYGELAKEIEYGSKD
jgi:chromosome partitioning protein